MGKADQGNFWDRVAEAVGGVALGLGAAVTAWLTIPADLAGRMAGVAVVGVIGTMIGWLLVRIAGAKRPEHLLASFAVTAYRAEPELPIDWNAEGADDELLLDEPLPDDHDEQPPVESRVVSLFGAAAVPTAGELQQRIDAHLSTGIAEPLLHVVPDASDALYEALADLRRSLRG